MFYQPLKSILSKVVLCASFVMLSVSAHAFTEGTDYVVLEKIIPNAQGTLIKVFSYDCPFCYRYEKSVVHPVVEKLDGILVYEPFHLETKATYGKEGSLFFATMIVKDQENGKTVTDKDSLFSKAKMAYYNAYHDKKERWDGGADDFVKTGLTAVGMTKAEYEEAQKNPKVQELLDEWKVSYDVAKIQGVPAFVVNGKYLIMTKNIKSIDSMVDLIKELNNKP